jgi:murein DD-endopeptidase MepM/ murein hydrolase activator NlpD
LQRYQASAAAPSRRSAIQAGLLVTAAAALALAWYTSPEKIAGYLADRLPHLFLTNSPVQAELPTPPRLARSATAASAPAADTTPTGHADVATPTGHADVTIAGREPPVAVAAIAPAPAEAGEPAAPVIKVVAVERGDTLIDILLASGVARDDAVEAIDALDGVFRPKDLKPGQEITLGFDQFGHHPVEQGNLQLASLNLQPSVEREVVVNRNDSGGFVAEATDRPLELKVALAGATIESSLFEAGQDAAIPIDILSQTIKAFSYDVDFQREIQPGDRFEIVYERYEDERGQLARAGNVLYAVLIQEGTTKEIYRFEPRDGGADFYNARGENVRKELLRTPLDVVRITSTFGMRKHPILGYSKMHKGVDFAASTGTPIFAAGDGVIAILGNQRGYGNYIRIKHNAQYATAYGHMSRFASGLRQGSKVRQGDVIGYVGSTGMATGPHLHYEVLVDGTQINPMSVKLAGRKLDGKELQRFEALKAEIKQLRKNLASQVLIARNQGR